MKEQFHFAGISNIETQTFDNSLESFHSLGINGTIRENIQNSIDARLIRINEPVKININLTNINKKDLPGIEEIEKHIMSLIGGNAYTTETIDDMKKSLKQKNIPVLTFEDNNTKGLSGADQIAEKTTYNTFAYKKGVHFEDVNNDIETVRGGSHGVGKIANNAASDIHLMYFSNCDEMGNKHIGGTIQLVEHRIKDRSYRSTGYFSGFNNNQYEPYLNEQFNPIFAKNTRGLKVVIPFVRKSYGDVKGIVRAVCDNFFLALLTDKLEVMVSDGDQIIAINKQTIQSISRDSYFYPENINNIQEITKNFTPLYIESYMTKTSVKLEILSNKNLYSFNLFFIYDELIKTGRVGIVRSMGMKILDYKVRGYIRRPFNAVLIGGPKEDEYLKTLENESHTELSVVALRNDEFKRDAKKFILNLNKKIGRIIDNEWEKSNPSDGKINTSDLLYEKEVTFKSKLEELSEKVEMLNGKQLRKKKVKEARANGYSKGQRRNPTNVIRKRKPRKLKPSVENERIVETILAPNEIVSRMTFLDKEVVQFDLNSVEGVPLIGHANLSFRVVDGEGKEHENEFDLRLNYSEIINNVGHKDYDFDNYTIFNVPIVNGMIRMTFHKKTNLSDTLKFIYKLEVLG
ncbi:hypothetical protein [Brochothrix thermosphacta]|uniref:hypothetical protein n=1 Tax=Brochothrix thermosphacta TaxID=2756 RepID=UPI00265CF767|nr:hypothetical protein [Brochothrix thermosphacta]WKK69967.1 hypothetical protein Q0G00_05140 [Brochothrix thermosphacta]